MIENRDQTLITTPGWEFKLEFGKELLENNEFKLAEKMLDEALNIAEKKHGQGDPRLARIHSFAADLYLKKNDQCTILKYSQKYFNVPDGVA